MGNKGPKGNTKGLFLQGAKVSEVKYTVHAMHINHFYRFSVLPALSLTEGVLHCDIIEGAFDTTTFYSFIERTLDRMQPFPAPNSVIVMDNCRIHKHPAIQQLIVSRYAVVFVVTLLLLIYLQGHVLRVLATIFTRLQSHRTPIFRHEISPSSQWGLHPLRNDRVGGE